MRRSILACGLVLAFAGATTAAAGFAGAAGFGSGIAAPAGATTTTSGAPVPHVRRARHAVAYWRRRIRRYRAGARRWLTVIRGRPPQGVSRSLSARSLPGLRRLALAWRRREHAAWRRATHPPALQGWLCIHRYEGSWTDSGPPYWGGLQMDYAFQATYVGWLLRHRGTADRWSPLEQIWVAVRAWRVRGFPPWPNTARLCGMG